MTEDKLKREMLVPTFDEYMNSGRISVGAGVTILPSLYFVGPKLSLEIIRSQEYHDLLRLVGICGRLLNDLHTVEVRTQNLFYLLHVFD